MKKLIGSVFALFLVSAAAQAYVFPAGQTIRYKPASTASITTTSYTQLFASTTRPVGEVDVWNSTPCALQIALGPEIAERHERGAGRREEERVVDHDAADEFPDQQTAEHGRDRDRRANDRAPRRRLPALRGRRRAARRRLRPRQRRRRARHGAALFRPISRGGRRPRRRPARRHTSGACRRGSWRAPCGGGRSSTLRRPSS